MLPFVLEAHAQTVTTERYFEISRKIAEEENAAQRADLFILRRFIYPEKAVY